MHLKTDLIQFVPTEMIESEIFVDQNGCKKSFSGRLNIESIPDSAAQFFADFLLTSLKSELTQLRQTNTKIFEPKIR